VSTHTNSNATSKPAITPSMERAPNNFEDELATIFFIALVVYYL